MEVMAELNTEFFDDSAPAVGPGGLVNLSRVSRDLSKGQSTKDEALRALPPPPPPPQKKRSDLYGPGVGARGPVRDADDAARRGDAPAAPAAPAATPAKKMPAAAPKTPQERALRDALEAEDLRAAPPPPAPPPGRCDAVRSGARRRSSSSPRTSTRRSGAAAASRPSRRPAASRSRALRRDDDAAASVAAASRRRDARARRAARLGALAVGAGRRGHALARDRAPAALRGRDGVRRLAPLASRWRAEAAPTSASPPRCWPPSSARSSSAAARRRRWRGGVGPRRARAAPAGLAAAGPDATAALLALAWLSKPDVDGLRRRSTGPRRPGPAAPRARLRRRGRLRARAASRTAATSTSASSARGSPAGTRASRSSTNTTLGDDVPQVARQSATSAGRGRDARRDGVERS
ncbi:hypothetical protein JL720_16524 [Aureococcus anophagefferens]|nr:hypothetical protein JL720_16524 [Aureococcus anophagefferens]